MTDQKRTIESTIDTNNQTLTISTIGHPPIVIGYNDLSQSIIEYAALHGLKQKIVDAAALGRDYSTAEKYNAMIEVYQRLLSGEWNSRGEGGGTPTGLLFRALCRLYPAKSPEALREFIDTKSKSEQAALRKNPRIAAIIETIKAESAKTNGVNTDDMLDELEGVE